MSEQTRKMDTYIMRVAAREADTDTFYVGAERLGALAARALTHQKRSQITGLETLACSTQRVSDIFDYIKLRTARQSEWRTGEFGPALLTHLQTTLRERRDRAFDAITETIDDSDRDRLRHLLYLLLIRTFLGQLAAQYEYTCMMTT
jgi:hypothetical protein